MQKVKHGLFRLRIRRYAGMKYHIIFSKDQTNSILEMVSIVDNIGLIILTLINKGKVRDYCRGAWAIS